MQRHPPGWIALGALFAAAAGVALAVRRGDDAPSHRPVACGARAPDVRPAPPPVASPPPFAKPKPSPAPARSPKVEPPLKPAADPVPAPESIVPEAPQTPPATADAPRKHAEPSAKRGPTVVRTLNDPLAFAPGIEGAAHADEWVDPPGEYRSIAVADLIRTLTAINGRDSKARAAAIDDVTTHAGKFAPPALFAAGRALFDDGRKEDGAFWYYAGMLRARCDAHRCTDRTVADAPTVLIQTYGPPISKWAYLDLDALERRVAAVAAWDEKTPHDYDVRWIALHGMGSIRADEGATAPLTVPKDGWPALEAKARADWAAGWKLVLEKQFGRGKK